MNFYHPLVSRKYIFSILLSFLFGVGLHFLLTMSYKGNDIRISTTDYFLPFVFIFIAFEAWKYKWIPALKIKYGLAWLIILTIWILISFFVGVVYTDSIQKWPLFNKVIGWFILMGYFLCGVWIGDKNIKIIFLKFFIITGFLTALYGVYRYWMTLYGFYEVDTLKDLRIEGFSDNPNAFGILMACVFMLQLPFMRNEEMFAKKLHYLFSSIILLAVYYSLSRSAWLGLILGLIGILFIKRTLWKNIALSACFFILMNILLFEAPDYINSISGEVANSEKIFINNNHMLTRLTDFISPINNAYANSIQKNAAHKWVLDKRISEVDDSTINARIDMFKRALGYWVENPIFGLGIGGYRWKSQQAGENPEGYHIHSTGIWLLTEMGIVGFLLFLIFFVLCFMTLIGRQYNEESICIGVVGVLLVMLGASFGTEILYQRYLWFLLGLALVISNDKLNYAQD